LVVLIYGCTWVVLKLTGQECPIIVLPITMAIVFGVELLTVFIVAPLAERLRILEIVSFDYLFKLCASHRTKRIKLHLLTTDIRNKKFLFIFYGIFYFSYPIIVIRNKNKIYEFIIL